jgi:hypothetical protein
MRSRTVTRTLVVIGAVLAGLGLVAGHINREVLDGPRFAEHVDEIRRDDEVAAALGEEIATRLILSNPNLVALRPLVESVSTRVAGSDILSAPTQVAARTAHRALTQGDADSMVLRIADAGAVVSAVINAVAPERAPVSADVSVTLASVGSQELAADVLAATRLVGVLAWLLPVLALGCFGVAIGLSRDRWATAASVGRSLVWAAASVGALLLVGGFLVRRLDPDELGGAFGRAAWAELVRPMWWGVAVVAIVGITIAIACGSDAPAAMARWAARARAVALRPPQRPWAVVLRAAVAVALGVMAITDPLGLLEPLIVVTGIGLVLFAIAEIARVAAAARPDRAAATAGNGDRGGRRHPVALVVAALAGIVVVGGVVLLAWPGRDVEATDVATGEGVVCNGHAELCDRPFDDVAFVAAHNAMSVAREPGWYLAEQVDPIATQLDQGVRALLIDVWSGIPADTVVRTAPGSYADALAVANAELGPEIVDAALRIADSIAGEEQGEEARFLCHGLCEIGSTPFLDSLGDIRAWLAVHPDEVVTLFIEDHVDASLIAADVEAAGLLPFVHQPVVGEPWPTLGEMIRSGRRLVVMLEEGRGGDAAPWLVNGFELTQETPYTFPTVESFSCDPNRGPSDAPLFQLNHWLSGFTSLVSDAELVNARDVLLDRAEQCEAERGQLPSFVAVNFVVIGDVFEVVDELNGVG